jgi:hypothetical protein
MGGTLPALNHVWACPGEGSRVLLPTGPGVRYHVFTAAAHVTSGVSRVTRLFRRSSTSEPSRGASAERSGTGTESCRTLYPLSGVL